MPSILSNVSAMAASRQLGITSAGMKQTIERLTTGKRINRASDDAAGLTAANAFDAQSRRANEDVKAANNAYFAAQASDGYLAEATTQVQRLVELYQSGNGASSEATNVKANTTTATAKAASGAAGAAATAITTANTAIGNISNFATASTALASIDAARGEFAAIMASKQSAANLFGIEAENATAQASNLRDADIGSEVVNLTKWQILSQAGTSALSTANQSSQSVLALFR